MTAPVCGSCGSPVSDASICTGCTRDLAALLLTAASIAPDLDDAVARLLKRGSGGRRSETEAPLPVDLAAAEVAERLHRTLWFWVVETDRFPHAATRGPAHVACAHQTCMLIRDAERPPRSLRAMAKWLGRRTSLIRRHDMAARMLAEIRRAVRDALAVIDRAPERSPAGNCPQCKRELLAELDTDTAVCACGNVVTGLLDARYERALKADQLGTAAELSAFLARIGISVPRGTITSWASRGRLGTRGKSGMYALSDVLALHAERQNKPRVRG